MSCPVVSIETDNCVHDEIGTMMSDDVIYVVSTMLNRHDGNG